MMPCAATPETMCFMALMAMTIYGVAAVWIGYLAMTERITFMVMPPETIYAVAVALTIYMAALAMITCAAAGTEM